MKVIDVKDQVRLSFAKCVELVLSGIKYRLFRASITVVIIGLAVAFLMTMLTESFVARRVADEIDTQTAPRRMFLFWVSRMSSPLTEKDLSAELSEVTPRGARWKEYQTWGKLSDAELDKLAGVARRQQTYLTFFEDELDEGKRRPLVGPARGAEIFALLQDKEAFATFERELGNLGKKMPTDLESFRTFLADWSATLQARQAILNGNGAAVAALQVALAGREPKVVLAQPDQSLLSALDKMGFQPPSPGDLKSISEQASLSLDADRVARLLNIGLVKNRLADRTNVKLADVNAFIFFSEISSSRGAQWLKDLLSEMSDDVKKLETELPQMRSEVAKLRARAADLEELVKDREGRLEALKAKGAAESELAIAKGELKTAEDDLKELTEGKPGPDGKVLSEGLTQKAENLERQEGAAKSLLPAKKVIESFDLSAERMKTVAETRIDQNRLAEVESSVSLAAGRKGGFLGYSSRTLWLIAVSFVVCVVGITNAMLMSVTDRFREIATMKCLGATDGFIMLNFVLESCLQGTAGAVIGTVLGFVLGSLRSLASYGWMAMEHVPILLILTTAGISLVAGVVLSALAAVYPAWIAARLAPMEAMRIE